MRGQQNGSKHTHCGWMMVNGSMKRHLVIRWWYVLFKIWQSLYTVASKIRNCINTIWQYYMNMLSITPWYRGAAFSDCPEIWQPLNTSAKQSYVGCVQQWQQHVVCQPGENEIATIEGADYGQVVYVPELTLYNFTSKFRRSGPLLSIKTVLSLW